MVNLQRILTSGIAAVGAMIFLSPIAHADTGVCPDSWGCGANAATVGDGIVFDELNSQHKLSKDNVRMGTARVVVNGIETAVELSVIGHELSAKDTHNTVYKGPALKGMIMTIGHSDGRQYEVRVEKVCDPINGASECRGLDFWVHPTPDDQVPYYELKVRKTQRRNIATSRSQADDCRRRADDGARADDRCEEEDFVEQVCKGASLTDDAIWIPYKNAAIFLEGDRFDAESKRVSPPVGDGWFNLACAGAVVAKMHLLRHTAAGADLTHTTTLEQRTAMLKMLTADFCGDGRAWTADGTPLFYTDARGWHPTPNSPLPGPIEALWGPTGALCLNTPRRAPNATTNCTPPAVTRPEVVISCTKILPICDHTWLATWYGAQNAADAPYVLSAIKPSTLRFCGQP
jgi:hypothetical protein